MIRSPMVPLRLLRSISVLNGVAVAVLFAAVWVFARHWPQGLSQVWQTLAGSLP